MILNFRIALLLQRNLPQVLKRAFDACPEGADWTAERLGVGQP
jgi:hypothetical protein